MTTLPAQLREILLSGKVSGGELPHGATNVWGHCVDLGYDTNGQLVAVKIWDLVARRKR